jgi:serralysin
MRRRALLLFVAVTAALMLASGVAMAVTKNCPTYKPATGKGKCIGTKGRDTLRGNNATNYMDGRRGRDTLKGFDSLDFLSGGPGNDTLNGGGSGDSYFYQAGNWGSDRITDTVISDSDPTVGNLVLFGGVFVGLTIDLNSDSGPLPEVKETLGTSTINWDGDVINLAYGGFGGDAITGNDAVNYIRGSTGADNIHGEGGNDLIVVSDDSAGGDTVDCGENAGGDAVNPDNDTVRYNSGDTPPINCETMTLE